MPIGGKLRLKGELAVPLRAENKTMHLEHAGRSGLLLQILRFWACRTVVMQRMYHF